MSRNQLVGADDSVSLIRSYSVSADLCIEAGIHLPQTSKHTS